jgi:hypothetical protein
MLSTDTNSLAVWLAARQRENLAEMEEPLVLMTLEEYELMGSWLDVAGKAKEKDGEWTCVIDVHDQKDAQSTVTEVTELTAPPAEEATAQSPEAQEKAGTLDLPQARHTDHKYPHFRSLPQLQLPKWSDSVEDMTTSTLKASPISRPLSVSRDSSSS